jgi:segregation and condensation protein A
MSWATPAESDQYQVATEVYEGPLDLLLDLIERAELDITTLSLAQVTDQYIAHLQRIQEQNPADVSAFIVIAAKLIQIKSNALLPHTPMDIVEGEEEDPGEALTRQLILYKQFKELGNYLDQRSISGLRSYLRLAPPPKIPGKVNLEGLTLADLVEAAKFVFLSKNSMQPLSNVITIPRVTIRERIRFIIKKLQGNDKVSFRSLLSHKRTRVDIVVTFLAILELVKRSLISASQEILFGDISLETISDADFTDEDQLEFND